jgi:hypothetical protein
MIRVAFQMKGRTDDESSNPSLSIPNSGSRPTKAASEMTYDLHVVSERLNENHSGIDADEWDAAAPDTPHPSEQDQT